MLRIFIFQLLLCLNSFASDTIFLHSGWKLLLENKNINVDAKVPGCVHTDLYRNKIIENPFFGNNEKNIQWLENEDFIYITNFIISKEELSNDYIFIVFEGIDTYADVFLNNVKIEQSNNMFRTYKIDCKKLLRSENELKLIFKSASITAKELSKNNSVELPGEERVYTRKAQYQFGWDWGPRFVTGGIWKPVYLLFENKISVSDIKFTLDELSSESALIKTQISIDKSMLRGINLKIKDKNSDIIFFDKNISLKTDNNKLKLSFYIENAKLWWCNGLGEPFLYDFEIIITDNNKELFKTSKTFGIRKIELIQEKDSIGTSFYFKLNNKAVFIKGANYIPAEFFPSETTNEKYEQIIKNAKEFNFNMLRVWGGGIFENDKFYNYCDKYGIMVWQDFMFACAMYPGDSSFFENVKSEIIDNVSRLYNHPSIAVWCGNNEIDEGWHNWGWQKQYNYSTSDSTKIWNDYLALFENTIPNTLKEIDNSRNYISTSPKIGWGRKESMTEGDSHYWGVWWGMEPFEKYNEKVPRFMSEFGFQAIPELSSVKKFCDFNNNFPDSVQFRNHQKHPTGFETIKTYMEREYNIPKYFEHYIYTSQLLQAYGIKTAIEAHRKAKPYCMGTLYWQLNDCWPVVSWSSVDYYQKPKALHYFIKKLYENILICSEIKNDSLIVDIINDTAEFKANLNIKLMDFDGKIYWEKTNEIFQSGKNTQQKFDLKEIINSINAKKALIQCQININGEKYESISYFCLPKHMDLIKSRPKLKVKKIDSENYLICLQSKTLIKNLFLYSDFDMELADNYFDLLPQQKKEIIIKSKQSLKEIKNSLKIQALNFVE